MAGVLGSWAGVFRGCEVEKAWAFASHAFSASSQL